VSLRLTQDQPPRKTELQSESELTKRLVGNWSQFEVHDGLIYRRCQDTPKGEGDYLQLLLPREGAPDALNQCHAGVVGGHFGEKKTMEQVRRRFYWDHWKEDVRRFCRQCLQCNRYHRGKLWNQGPLQPVVPGAPFERWYIDLTGPHPKSEHRNLWILTCMDSFTKWAEAFPLRNKEAEPIPKILVEQVFSRFGIPLSILSDQGKEVDGRIMREVCRLFGIEKLRTTPYKPSTNQVERFHRTLNSILGKTVAEHQKDWDTRLVFAMSAYRATRHKATGYSPNFLVLGREARAPPDIVHEYVEAGDKYDPFVERLRNRQITAYAEVRAQLQWGAGYNKRYYDIGVKPSRFEAGQWVWYFNPRKLKGKQMKWTQQYEGPYLVLKMLSPLVAKIQQSSRAKPKIVHIDKLKKYEGEEPRMWSTAEVATAAQQDGDREGATGLYIPSSSASERSTENLAMSAGALEEAHFEHTESVDEWMNPSPILGVVDSHSDEAMALVHGEEDYVDASGESSVSRTSTRSTVGEVAMDEVEAEEVLQDARLDHPTSTEEVQFDNEEDSNFWHSAGPGSVESIEEWSSERQRPTRATRRPTHFRDSAFETQFRPEEKRKRCNWLGRETKREAMLTNPTSSTSTGRRRSHTTILVGEISTVLHEG